jgi:hypothetical protein
VGGTSGALISSGLQDTIRTNGTPAVTSAGKPTTLSSTMTSGLARSTIAESWSWQYLAPPMSSSQTGLIQVSSCSIVGLRNSGAVWATKSFQNCPASWPPSAGAARSTRSSSKPSGSSLPFQDASAAKTTRCPRLRSTSPIPMQLLVGPYALSGNEQDRQRPCWHGGCSSLGWYRRFRPGGASRRLPCSAWPRPQTARRLPIHDQRDSWPRGKSALILNMSHGRTAPAGVIVLIWRP